MFNAGCLSWSVFKTLICSRTRAPTHVFTQTQTQTRTRMHLHTHTYIHTLANARTPKRTRTRCGNVNFVSTSVW